MKTKLLKEVRKRYEILKITEVSLNFADSFYRECEKDLGLPFYVLNDNYDIYGIRTTAFNDYNIALDKIRKWIREDYTQKVKKIKTIENKVWYR